jgi:hypothetical protein
MSTTKDKNPPADPAEIVREVSDLDKEWENLSSAPPAISGYRDANVAGMACWNCGHFTAVGDPDNDDDLDGICNLFEAQADATSTCDRFTAHADLLRQSPHTTWHEDMANMREDAMGPSMMGVDYSDASRLASLNFAGEASEEDGLVWKDILRTGKWTHTPTAQGVVKKTLVVNRDGESDPENGILSLAEIEQHFNEGAVPYVTVPLSDDEKDHKNIARLNTGFVRKLKLVERDGQAYLQAGIDFTEPDIKGKVLRGTIPDVSAGIPFNVVRRSDNKIFKTVLDHVCLTRKPFVEKLVPFGIAAADTEELPVEAWEPEGEDQPAPPVLPENEDSPPSTPAENPEPSLSEVLSFREYITRIQAALIDQLRLAPDYVVTDIKSNTAYIEHKLSHSKWEVSFSTTKDGNVVLAEVNGWKLIEEPSSEPSTALPLAASDSLTVAQNLRELRLSQPTSKTGGIELSTMPLDGVELSALPEESRARIQSILDENATLNRENRVGKVDQRIEELKALPGLNLSDRPGALKLYRQVMLSDDGGPAIVLFSDEQDEEKKERLTALDILDRFINGLKAGADVQLSDQHLASGNDIKPPKDASRENKPLDDRVADAKEALYGKRNRRK